MQYLKYFPKGWIHIAIPVILGIIIISCEKEDNSVIDPVLNIPSISDPVFTPSSFDSDTINAVATVRVSSIDPIKQVSVTLINPKNEGQQAFLLRDDGVAPDLTAGDGIYSARVIFVQQCRLVGTWKAEYIAETVDGLLSNTEQRNFTVQNSNNLPPIVSELIIIPDSTQVNFERYFIFRIKAIDPNGSCDIRRVICTGFRPDNSALSPLDLYDDGDCCIIPPFNSTSGDTTANNSIFTRRTFGAPLLTGYYRYFLKAVDRSDDTSNVLADSIYVYP